MGSNIPLTNNYTRLKHTLKHTLTYKLNCTLHKIFKTQYALCDKRGRHNIGDGSGLPRLQTIYKAPTTEVERLNSDSVVLREASQLHNI